jgi:hypothetical protein
MMINNNFSSNKLIILKGWLFLLIAVLSSVLLVLKDPSLTTIAILVIVIWSFARFYYFMFYVVTNYINSNYKYSGPVSFIKFLFKK